MVEVEKAQVPDGEGELGSTCEADVVVGAGEVCEADVEAEEYVFVGETSESDVDGKGAADGGAGAPEQSQ